MDKTLFFYLSNKRSIVTYTFPTIQCSATLCVCDVQLFSEGLLFGRVRECCMHFVFSRFNQLEERAGFALVSFVLSLILLFTFYEKS